MCSNMRKMKTKEGRMMAEFCKKHCIELLDKNFERAKKYGWWCGEDGLCEECGFEHVVKEE